jgi:hypothetical protein
MKKSVRYENIISQEDGRFTIIFKDEFGKVYKKPNCSFCINGDANLFDDEIFTIHFEKIIAYDDIDEVCNQYKVK